MSKTKLRPDSGVLNILQSDISLQMQDSFLWFWIPSVQPSAYRRTKQGDFEE